MIRYDQLKKMKQDAILINTSRGGIVNEADLARVLNEGHLLGAAIDVFEQEPYAGELGNIDHCYLTSHMGSMTVDCRSRMEIEATQEAIRFLANESLLRVWSLMKSMTFSEKECEMKKICVFGGGGFLGSHVADSLSDDGNSVRIFDRIPSILVTRWARR
jgi:phosphoglycerate dehydrogenase-like enzyme